MAKGICFSVFSLASHNSENVPFVVLPGIYYLSSVRRNLSLLENLFLPLLNHKYVYIYHTVYYSGKSFYLSESATPKDCETIRSMYPFLCSKYHIASTESQLFINPYYINR